MKNSRENVHSDVRVYKVKDLNIKHETHMFADCFYYSNKTTTQTLPGQFF